MSSSAALGYANRVVILSVLPGRVPLLRYAGAEGCGQMSSEAHGWTWGTQCILKAFHPIFRKQILIKGLRHFSPAGQMNLFAHWKIFWGSSIP